MTVNTDFDLGDQVVNQYTGTCGHVISIGDHLTGCTRIGVRSESVSSDDRSDHQETEFYYPAELSVITSVDERENIETPPQSIEDTETDVTLGNEVKDTVTGITGIVTTITYNMYNCPRVAINPTREGGEYSNDREWFDLPRVEVVDDGVAAEFDELAESTDESDSGAASSDYESKSHGLY